MPASKPMARLGLLAVVALAGLSACATWPAYRVPQGAFGDSPDVVMTSSPPGAAAAANPDVAAPPSPGVPTIAPTISVPGPVVVNSAVQPRIDSESSGLAANAPPAAPEASQSTGVTLTDATAPAAESNRDQLQPQKPLDATSPNSDPSSAGQQAAGGVVPGQTAPGAGSAAPAASATVTVARPPGALARLRARFHKLIQPTPKPVSKTAKDKDGKSHDAAAAPHEPAQPVLTVHIPLPTSDESRVAKEDARTPHGLFPAEEGPGPVSTAAVGVAQVGAPPAPAASQAEPVPPREVSAKPAAGGQIEQWPYSPQAVAGAPEASSAPVPANEFDPIPVDEYRATVARVNGNANSLPAFHASQSTANDALHASASPAVTVPPPAASTPPTTEQHVVPTVDAKPTVNEPALMRIDQAQPPGSAKEQGVSSARVDSQERPAPEQPPQMAQPSPPQTDATPSAGSPTPIAPAVQTSAALPVQAAPAPPVQTPVQTPIVRSPQWIGGRYGQPAWMAPYASPAAVPSRN